MLGHEQKFCETLYKKGRNWTGLYSTTWHGNRTVSPRDQSSTYCNVDVHEYMQKHLSLLSIYQDMVLRNNNNVKRLNFLPISKNTCHMFEVNTACSFLASRNDAVQDGGLWNGGTVTNNEKARIKKAAIVLWGHYPAIPRGKSTANNATSRSG